MIIIIW